MKPSCKASYSKLVYTSVDEYEEKREDKNQLDHLLAVAVVGTDAFPEKQLFGLHTMQLVESMCILIMPCRHACDLQI